MPITVLIVDDHDVVRHGLRTLLELDPELIVAGEAADGDEAVECARRIEPDVVLMDLVMPGIDGITATRRIRADLPTTEVIGLTSGLERDSAADAVRAGAIAFLAKETRADELRRTIRSVAAGQVHFSTRLLERLVREVPPPPATTPLSNGEIGLLRRLATGDTNAHMAQAMAMDEAKVRAEVNGLLAKLGVFSRAHAVVYAVQNGLSGVTATS